MDSDEEKTFTTLVNYLIKCWLLLTARRRSLLVAVTAVTSVIRRRFLLLSASAKGRQSHKSKNCVLLGPRRQMQLSLDGRRLCLAGSWRGSYNRRKSKRKRKLRARAGRVIASKMAAATQSDVHTRPLLTTASPKASQKEERKRHRDTTLCNPIWMSTCAHTHSLCNYCRPSAGPSWRRCCWRAIVSLKADRFITTPGANSSKLQTISTKRREMPFFFFFLCFITQRR